MLVNRMDLVGSDSGPGSSCSELLKDIQYMAGQVDLVEGYSCLILNM